MKGLWKFYRFKLFGAFIILGLLSVPFFVYYSVDISELNHNYPHVILKKDSEDVDYDIKKDKPKDWVRLNQISKSGKWAIILSEDWSFYNHEGVDVEQMKVAFSEMVEEKRFRGASTISQQMVKNVYLSNSRTIKRKLMEYILTYKAEKALNKQRILEIYLNCIEFGPGIYGIKKAAYHYFRKHPSDLTPRESAFLALLLPSPKKYYVSFERKKLTKFAEMRIKAILNKLRMGKIISLQTYEEQLNSRFTWEPPLPVPAPEVADPTEEEGFNFFGLGD